MNEHAIDPSSVEALHIPPLRRRAHMRRLVSVGVLLAIGAAVIAFVMRPTPVAEQFRSVPLTRRTIVRLVDATGHIGVNGRVEIGATAPGRLVQIFVGPGARVKKGQLLAKIDDRAQRLSVNQAEASRRAAVNRVAEARVAYRSAVDEQQHSERLAQKGLASQQEAVNAKIAADKSAAALAVAEAEEAAAAETVASAALGRSAVDIVASGDGVVLTAPETAGMMVDPAQGTLFVLGQSLQALRIDAPINETDITQVSAGQIAHFEVQGLPGRTFDARVERIALDSKTEGGVVSYPVVLSVDNADGVLLPGMTAFVHLEIARAEGVLAVREAALRFAPADAPPAPPRTRLWRRAAAANAEPVRIRAGLSDGAFTEVTAADGEHLQEGDAIVIGVLRPGEIEAGKPGFTIGGNP